MADILKFITCGSVDDGKSTLIGHLLYDTKKLFADQIQRLELDSQVINRTVGLDYSLLLDGLSAEREQGITIDVAYRYFSTSKRSFIVADTPGHVQYTRNMAVGASFAQCAVLLVDATLGLLEQTKRHTRICSLMGIRHFILAVNKMDLVQYNEDVFNTICEEYQHFSRDFDLHTLISIPLSATIGDNLSELSSHMPWYQGQTLLQTLEEIEVEETNYETTLLPIQRVNRPHADYRGFQGEMLSGSLIVGDRVTIFPSLTHATIKSIRIGFNEVQTAPTGLGVEITFHEHVDASRGQVIVKGNQAKVSNQFQATLLWMDDENLEIGKIYTLKCGTRSVSATVMSIKHKLDIHTSNHLSTKVLSKNDIGVVTLSTSQPIVYTNFKDFRKLGSFILIDRVSHMTSCAGTIDFDLRRANNIHHQNFSITPMQRALIKGQTPKTYWFTGLSGSGKSTLANAMDVRFTKNGYHTMIVDGDNVRLGLNENLGFTASDRHENIRRVSHVCKLMNEAGLIVFASFITPTHEDQYVVKSILKENVHFIYVSTPLEVCMQRDVKGIYKKAIEENIPNFTGISAPFEPPIEPWMSIDTSTSSIEECIESIVRQIELDEI
jgi:bifunctional enzyme CysN/CysC